MIVCFTSYGEVGCTFLDWSFHWLLGHNKFWKDDLGLISLTPDPFNNKNAHEHQKNHPGTTQEWYKMIQNFKSSRAKFPVSFYGGWKRDKGTSSNNAVNQYLERIDISIKEDVKIIYLHKSTPYPYFQERSLNKNDLLKDARVWCLDWFPKVKNIEEKINSIGGLRDFLSYGINLGSSISLNQKIKDKIKINQNVLILDCKDWWINGFQMMTKIFNFLELSLNQERIEHWLLIYKKWQKTFEEYVQFEKLLPIIAQSIKEGKNLDLIKYDLNIVQEALILQKLMSAHGLRLKIKNLDIFPQNTIDLHRLIK